ncbi:MAG: hypothetical protein WD690_02630 [Vicinamibacterales bacterium]
MRTTITVDDDVAVRLERVMEKRRQTWKAVVNEALRTGVEALEKGRPVAQPYRIRPVKMGASVVGSLDNIEEVLSRVEGEAHR